MTPRQKQYHSEEEKKQAHRLHQKRYRERIKNKLKAIFNGNHKPTESIVSSSNHPESKPNDTAIIYDKFTGERIDTKENQSSVQEALNPKLIRSTCLYCNAYMGYEEAKQDDRCEFCRQFDCKEQALYEKMIGQQLARVNNSRDYDLYEKYLKELRTDWQCLKCHRVNHYYVKVCEGCDKSR